MDSEKLTFSVPEAAEALGISRNHAYKAAREGTLPVVKFGSRLLVPRAALLRKLDEMSAKPGAQVAA